MALAESRPLPELHSSADIRPLSMDDFRYAHEQVCMFVCNRKFCYFCFCQCTRAVLGECNLCFFLLINSNSLFMYDRGNEEFL